LLLPRILEFTFFPYTTLFRSIILIVQVSTFVLNNCLMKKSGLDYRLTSASNMNVNSENMSPKVMYCVFHMLHKITFACVCIILFITIMKSNITLNLMFNHYEKSLRYWMNSNIGISTLYGL